MTCIHNAQENSMSLTLTQSSSHLLETTNSESNVLYLCCTENKASFLFNWSAFVITCVILFWMSFAFNLQRNHLPCDWWDEGEGRQRRVLPLRCYVGSSGCCSEVQGAGNHCPAHQAEGHWWQQVRHPMHKITKSSTQHQIWAINTSGVFKYIWLLRFIVCFHSCCRMKLTCTLFSFLCFTFLRTKTPGPGAQSALRALARSGMKIGRIGELKCLNCLYIIKSVPCVMKWYLLRKCQIPFRFLLQRTSPPFHQTAPAEREVVVDVVCKLCWIFQNKKVNAILSHVFVFYQRNFECVLVC